MPIRSVCRDAHQLTRAYVVQATRHRTFYEATSASVELVLTYPHKIVTLLHQNCPQTGIPGPRPVNPAVLEM